MDQGWVTEFTLETVQKLDKNSKVLFAKGCGAMGSDVILVFCEKCHTKDVRNALMDLNLQVVADSGQVGQGLQIRNLSQPEVSL